MKSTFPQITLLGSNSGNNVGDAAILSAILESLTKELPEARFLVPTTNPDFVNRNYAPKYKVRALNIMPWNLSLRFLGLPAIRCLWKSDLALICDGIIFGKGLFNPAFNLLITLAPLAVLAKLLKCKLVCYSCGIGPFPRGRGARFARFLMRHCDLLMMRDDESKRLAEELGVNKPIELTGDAAFVNPVASEERAQEIARERNIDTARPLLGINITRYLDSWVNDNGRQTDIEDFLGIMERGVSSAKAATDENFLPVIFSTHPMDESVAKRLAERLDAPLVSNSEYLSHEMQAVMRMCSLFIGMRFHSLVLSSAVSVPVMALVYAPKVGGLMRSLRSPEYALTIASLSAEELAGRITNAWHGRIALLHKQALVVEKFKEGADYAARRVAEKFFPGSASSTNDGTAANSAILETDAAGAVRECA